MCARASLAKTAAGSTVFSLMTNEPEIFSLVSQSRHPPGPWRWTLPTEGCHLRSLSVSLHPAPSFFTPGPADSLEARGLEGTHSPEVAFLDLSNVALLIHEAARGLWEQRGERRNGENAHSVGTSTETSAPANC